MRYTYLFCSVSGFPPAGLSLAVPRSYLVACLGCPLGLVTAAVKSQGVGLSIKS